MGHVGWTSFGGLTSVGGSLVVGLSVFEFVVRSVARIMDVVVVDILSALCLFLALRRSVQ